MRNKNSPRHLAGYAHTVYEARFRQVKESGLARALINRPAVSRLIASGYTDFNVKTVARHLRESAYFGVRATA